MYRFSREDEASENGIPCVEALAQTIATLNHRTMKLAKEPSSVELGQATVSGALVPGVNDILPLGDSFLAPVA